MSLLLAAAVVGTGSVLMRVLPMLGARHLSDAVAEAAGWAGLGVIAAMTVRALLSPQAAVGVLGCVPGALAVGVGIFLASRGRSVLVAVGAGLVTDLLLTPLFSFG